MWGKWEVGVGHVGPPLREVGDEYHLEFTPSSHSSCINGFPPIVCLWDPVFASVPICQ
jgi:hypothetical protein